LRWPVENLTASEHRGPNTSALVYLGHDHGSEMSQDRQADTLLPIAAILVAVFVLEADFHPSPRPILVVITPAVAISVGAIRAAISSVSVAVYVVIVAAHLPIATYLTVVPVHTASHPVHHSPHVVLAPQLTIVGLLVATGLLILL
jgi:hypothetical protein